MSFLSVLLFSVHSLIPPVKLPLLGSSLGFRVPRPSCTWADVSLILFANPESSKSFTSGFTSRGDAPTPMLKYFLSCFPAANVHRLHERYSTNALIADIPAADNGVPGHGGCTMLQVYGGLDSELLYGHHLSSESELPNTLHDFICEYGAMGGLMSDNAKSETSFAMKDIFCINLIEDHQSEPHYQHQNPIEHQIQDMKCIMHGIMNHVACPVPYWLLCCL